MSPSPSPLEVEVGVEGQVDYGWPVAHGLRFDAQIVDVQHIPNLEVDVSRIALLAVRTPVAERYPPAVLGQDRLAVPDDSGQPADAAVEAVLSVVLRQVPGLPVEREPAPGNPVRVPADDRAEVRVRVRQVGLEIVEPQDDIGELAVAVRGRQGHDRAAQLGDLHAGAGTRFEAEQFDLLAVDFAPRTPGHLHDEPRARTTAGERRGKQEKGNRSAHGTPQATSGTSPAAAIRANLAPWPTSTTNTSSNTAATSRGYRLLTSDHVRVESAGGRETLHIEPEALRLIARGRDGRHRPPAAGQPPRAAAPRPRRSGIFGERPLRRDGAAQEREHRRRTRAPRLPGHRHRDRPRLQGSGRLHGLRRRRAALPRHLRRLPGAQPALLPDGAAVDVRGEEHRHEPARPGRPLRNPRRRLPVPVHRQGRRLGEQVLPVPGDEGDPETPSR